MTKKAKSHVDALTPKRRSIALFVVSLAFVMDLLDVTIINVALPSIQASLGASFATMQWLVAGYVLSFAVLLITGGRMGDVFGYKKLFLFGIVGFTAASLLCGIANTSELLVAARLLQGATAALMVPQVMSLMQVMYKPHERHKVMGLFGMLGGLAATLGPIIGGLLIDANLFGLDWRPIFLINLPIGIATFWAGLKYLPEGKSPHPIKLDVIGTGILIVALSLLIFPLIQGRELDWPLWIIWMLVASVPALAIFAWYERYKDRKDKSALVVPALLKTRSYVNGLMVNFVLQAAMLGFFLTFTIVLQAGLGFSPLNAALTGVPTAFGIGLAIATVQKLVPILGRYVISLGAIVAIIGFLLTAWVVNANGLDVPAWHFIPGLFLSGVGMGSIMGSLFSVMLQDVDPKHAGSASGVMSALQQVSGALGVALVGMIFFGHIASSAPKAFDQVAPQLQKELSALQLPAQAQESIIKNVGQCFADRAAQKDQSELPESCKHVQAEPTPAGEVVNRAVVQAAKEANAANFANAYNWATVFSVGVMTLTFLLSFTLPRHFKMSEAPAHV